MSETQQQDPVQAEIHKVVTEHPVVLFMKGTPDFPQCGFSGAAVQMLQETGVHFAAVNVLANQDVREGIKVYGDWPTIPQLYIKGELVGGSDILRQMHESGELKQMVEQAAA